MKKTFYLSSMGMTIMCAIVALIMLILSFYAIFTGAIWYFVVFSFVITSVLALFTYFLFKNKVIVTNSELIFVQLIGKKMFALSEIQSVEAGVDKDSPFIKVTLTNSQEYKFGGFVSSSQKTNLKKTEQMVKEINTYLSLKTG